MGSQREYMTTTERLRKVFADRLLSLKTINETYRDWFRSLYPLYTGIELFDIIIGILVFIDDVHSHENIGTEVCSAISGDNSYGIFQFHNSQDQSKSYFELIHFDLSADIKIKITVENYRSPSNYMIKINIAHNDQWGRSIVITSGFDRATQIYIVDCTMNTLSTYLSYLYLHNYTDGTKKKSWWR